MFETGRDSAARWPEKRTTWSGRIKMTTVRNLAWLFRTMISNLEAGFLPWNHIYLRLKIGCLVQGRLYEYFCVIFRRYRTPRGER